MRATHRQILASLTFLVPLGLLAWVGGQELRRQGERARTAVSDQAIGFLNLAKLRIDTVVERFVRTVLDEQQLDLVAQLPQQRIRELSNPDSGEIIAPQLRDILLLDEEGQMIFPRPPPADQGLALYESPGPYDLKAAEILEAQGHLEEAQSILEATLDPRRFWWDLDSLRAAMQLARINEARGFPLEAAEIYGTVVDHLNEAWASIVSDDFDWAVLSLLHLCASVKLAEIHNDTEEYLVIMQDISEGSYDDVADPALSVVMERLLDAIPEESAGLRAAALSARKTDRFRIDGRTFAASYERFLAERLRLRLRQPNEDVRYLYETLADDDGTWLLAFRRATRMESDFHGCEWVGVRLDLAFLLNEEVNSFLQSETGFTLAILDSAGDPILPAGPRDDPELPWVASSHGMQLLAIPGNVDAMLDADRASVQNRALLIVFLVLVAGGGAFFLWHSVHRESELAQLKVDLVSRVSHELKTPLSLIRLYGETLGMGRTKDQQQVSHFAGVITRESERLSNMIGRILDFSRQSAGTLHYDKERVELRSLVTSVIEAYRAHVEAHGASLQVQLTDGLHADVDADALQAAVLNLLENAVKYTPTGSPDREIRVELRRDNGHAIVEIKDRGMGVPIGEQGRVFDSFYRASNAGEARGAGLGLSLVRHFADAHGGTIEILARDGGGTTARLTLPVAENGETDGETD